MKPRLQSLLAFFRSTGVRKVLALIVVSLGTAFLVVERVEATSRDLRVGEVVDRDIHAPTSFQFVDASGTVERQARAEAEVLPVYDFDANLITRLRSRISSAFETAAQHYAEAQAAAQQAGQAEVPAEVRERITTDFVRMLDVSLEPNDLRRIVDARWDKRIVEEAVNLLGVALGGYVIADENQLPSPPRPVSVLRILQSARDEVRLDHYDAIRTPEEARQMMSIAVLEHAPSDLDSERVRAALAVARASVRPNLFYNQLITEERKSAARDRVEDVVSSVQRGTAILRAGDVVTEQHVAMLTQLRAGQGGAGAWEAQIAVAALTAMLLGTLYGFASGTIRRFSSLPRDIETLAFLLLLVLVLGRALRSTSEPIAQLIGDSLSPGSFWYLVPVAGGAMLVRILVNAETALLWVIPTAILAGLVVEQQALYILYFLVVGVAGVAGVAQTRERLAVLKAGLQTGLVGGVAALLLHLASMSLGDPVVAAASSPVGALWDVGFAILGGLLSSAMVLALVPLFEQLGYLTEYKLLELANLNHPLIKQLMLRAPGSYHHSIIVSTLSEAAAEAIEGNALLARVSCYFHDVGKALKPQYFIENKGDAPNRHNRLEPKVSARIIINHVLDGAAIARQYRLPEPIVDSIFMHHGTGLIPFFYHKALERAGPDEDINPEDYRYPGPRPNSRETGIIMLADKVEAACRTIKDPNPDKLREMIQKLVNTTIEDGQFEDCPLTLKELYTIIDTFVHTLAGIYHQRIEYPGPPPKSVHSTNPGERPRGSVITLEIPSPFARKDEEPSFDEDAAEEA